MIKNENLQPCKIILVVKKILRYCKQFPANIFNGEHEMDTFLEKHSLLKLTQEPIGNMKVLFPLIK